MRKKITHNITITYYINCSRYSSQLMLSENIWRISTQEKPFSPLTTIFWSLRMEMYLLRWWMRRTHWLQWNMSPARRADGDIMTWRMTLRVLLWSSKEDQATNDHTRAGCTKYKLLSWAPLPARELLQLHKKVIGVSFAWGFWNYPCFMNLRKNWQRYSRLKTKPRNLKRYRYFFVWLYCIQVEISDWLV